MARVSEHKRAHNGASQSNETAAPVSKAAPVANLTSGAGQIPCFVSMRLSPFILLVLGTSLLAVSSQGSVVFRPGEKVHYVAPGDEEMSGTAHELFSKGEEAEKTGDFKRAIKAYSLVFRRYPHDVLAPEAAFRCGQLLEQTRDFSRAATVYRGLMEKYPQSQHFEAAIEAQFRIGEMYLSGAKKVKLLGISVGSSMDRAVEIFAPIVKLAPYGKYTARAQFDIGLARQKQSANDAAVQAFQAVIDKFPNEPIAADAQYQIGYIWFEAARLGTHDQAATKNAKTAFEDFLFKYPKSEKVPQARENLALLDQKATTDAFKVAKFYDKEKAYRAAVIYYNEVIQQQPGSPASAQAQKRIAQIKAKVGETALLPAVQVSEKKKVASRGSASRGPKPTLRGGDAEVAPLPPPEQDSALPPPASLAPQNTTAPESSPSPEPSASPPNP